MTFLIIFILLAAVIMGGSYYAYRFVFYHKPLPTDPPYRLPEGDAYQKALPKLKIWAEAMYARPFEPVTIISRDGLTLFGRYYHTADNAPLQIQCHGYKGSAFIDFCGGSALAKTLGHNALVIDQRAHGKSEGHTISFGIRERLDCLSWIAYANERFGSQTPIILCGLSMGAASVLMASGEELPANVKGIFADCPYSSPKEIICKVGKDLHLPSALLYPFVRLGALLFGHINPEETDAVRAVQRAKVPILLIHGEADTFVPCDMSRQIYKNCASDITFVTVPDAGHGLCYTVSPDIYKQAVTGFFDRILQ